MALKNANTGMWRWMVVGVGGIAAIGAITAISMGPRDLGEWVAGAQRSRPSVQILPHPAKGYHELRVSGGVLNELRLGSGQDTETGTTLVWSVNGEDVAEGLMLSPEFHRRGDVVRVRVQKPENDADAETFDAQVVIGNAPPVVRGARLVRNPVRPSAVELKLESTDPDHDPLTTEVEWMLNGKAWPSARGLRVDVSDVPSGSEIQARVAVSDGAATIETSTDPLRLANQPPTLEIGRRPQVENRPDGSRLAVLEAHSTDPDGDRVTIRPLGASGDVRWDEGRGALVWSVMDGLQSFDVTLVADDARGGRAERTLTLRR